MIAQNFLSKTKSLCSLQFTVYVDFYSYFAVITYTNCHVYHLIIRLCEYIMIILCRWWWWVDYNFVFYEYGVMVSYTIAIVLSPGESDAVTSAISMLT